MVQFDQLYYTPYCLFTCSMNENIVENDNVSAYDKLIGNYLAKKV